MDSLGWELTYFPWEKLVNQLRTTGGSFKEKFLSSMACPQNMWVALLRFFNVGKFVQVGFLTYWLQRWKLQELKLSSCYQNEGEQFHHSTMTNDKIWAHYIQSIKYYHKASLGGGKKSRHRIQLLLVIFGGHRRCHSYGFPWTGITINSECCSAMLKTLKHWLRIIWNQKKEFLLQHDIANIISPGLAEIFRSPNNRKREKMYNCLLIG